MRFWVTLVKAPMKKIRLGFNMAFLLAMFILKLCFFIIFIEHNEKLFNMGDVYGGTSGSITKFTAGRRASQIFAL